MQISSRATAACAAVLVPLLLAGCGEAGKNALARTPRPDPVNAAAPPEKETFADRTGDEVVEQATEAMRTLRSVHMHGTLVVDGTELTLDLNLGRGDTCRGTVSAPGHGTTEVLGIDGDWWLRLDREAWSSVDPEQGPAAADYVGDRWVVAAESEDFEKMCDLEAFLQDTMRFGRGLGRDGGTVFRNDGVDRVDGQRVVVAKPTQIRGIERDPATAYVQAGGRHLVVRLEDRLHDTGFLAFDRFDRPVDAARPAADEMVDIGLNGTTV